MASWPPMPTSARPPAPNPPPQSQVAPKHSVEVDADTNSHKRLRNNSGLATIRGSPPADETQEYNDNNSYPAPRRPTYAPTTHQRVQLPHHQDRGRNLVPQPWNGSHHHKNQGYDWVRGDDGRHWAHSHTPSHSYQSQYRDQQHDQAYNEREDSAPPQEYPYQHEDERDDLAYSQQAGRYPPHQYHPICAIPEQNEDAYADAPYEYPEIEPTSNIESHPY